MKRLISLFLAIMMCIALAACANASETDNSSTEAESKENILSKEELLESAIEVKALDINNLTIEDVNKAKEEYCDKTLKMTGPIERIEEEYIEIGYHDCAIKVYLSSEEISMLEEGQQVTVVGQTSDSIEEYNDPSSTVVDPTLYYEMSPAYFVEDYFEVTGVIQTNGIKVENIDAIRGVQWAEGVDKSEYEWKKVTISAKVIDEKINGNYIRKYYDATVVEVIEE